jgi:hypothetical protein
MNKNTLFGAGVFALAALSIVGLAHAETISITDLGTVNPANGAAPVGSGITVSNVNNAPEVVGSSIVGGNPSVNPLVTNPFGATNYTDGTVGWNPFGGGTNTWISIGGANGTALGGASEASITFSFTSPTNILQFVWGSSSATNEVALYSGTGALLGTITADGSDNLDVAYSQGGATASVFYNANLANVTSAGPLIDIASTTAIAKAVFTDSSGGFEIGQVSSVPLPAALPLFGSAVLAAAGWARRRRKALAA